MSIKDYSQRFIITNGTTHDIIKIPHTDYDDICTFDISINDYMLLRCLKEELHQTDNIVVSKTYMKD